jgi:hypothetical protein
MRWVRRGVALAVLVIGWVFIAWQNHFHITAPLVFVCLGYLAVIATVYNLWRTGASVVEPSDEDADSTWAQPVGALGELEREKRTLLKAIKEAEFDHQMGKLSQRDADEMIRSYRARAIDVIKEIDRLSAGTDAGSGGTVRDQILREVRARVELDAKAARKADAGAPRAEPRRTPKGERVEAGQPPAVASGARAAPGSADAGAAAEAADAKASAAGGAAAASSAPAAAADRPSAAGDEPPARPHDEELDADSTTALEPRRDDRAKEATP